MKLVGERIGQTQELAEELRSGRKVTRADLEIVKELVSDEQESMAKSKKMAANQGLNEQYRRNMAKAVENSAAVIELLKEALEQLRARDSTAASATLMTVVAQRGRKASQDRGINLGKLYDQYAAETDLEFHAWLRKNGHTEALKALGKVAPK